VIVTYSASGAGVVTLASRGPAREEELNVGPVHAAVLIDTSDHSRWGCLGRLVAAPSLIWIGLKRAEAVLGQLA